MKQTILFILLSAYVANSNAEGTPPYMGQESRDIKSLSPERVAGLQSGKGLGYAKVAELNGFPGPAHVLELAYELELTEEQKIKTQAIFDAMQADAKSLGEALIEAERQLDDLFTNGEVSESVVSAKLAEIGAIEGRLRAIHINAHLKQKLILSRHQIHKYNQLRGYSSEGHRIGFAHDHHE